jgi:hypothetical protein
LLDENGKESLNGKAKAANLLRGGCVSKKPRILTNGEKKQACFLIEQGSGLVV